MLWPITRAVRLREPPRFRRPTRTPLRVTAQLGIADSCGPLRPDVPSAALVNPVLERNVVVLHSEWHEGNIEHTFSFVKEWLLRVKLRL